ncbi:major tail protein [Paraclostridium sordellii]|uniref:major tail protein n=1 Tax=Paraclostridium sordellii TaxID=1505 RepID=UPI0005E08C5E|nr:major tail protein [Paeniclostridium sordellii]CEO27340.1 phage major tail protein [[Clostridium] sordellii] [Paeniclostridium sordellii]
MAAQRILPVVNVSKLYVAHLKTETDESITFDTPRYLEGIKQIGIKPKQNSDPYYHEGRKVLEEQTLQDVKVTLNITDLSDEDECYVMGHKLAKTGGVIKNDNDIAPTLAILYKAEKSQGIDKYGILYAGTFGLSDEDLKDKEGKANFQAKKIEASFRPLINGLWQYNVCSDSPNVTPEFLKNFFKQVTIAEEKTDEISSEH